MAAAMESDVSQNILGEVRQFIQGVSKERSVSSESLAQSALCLLQTLPAARHAVLEYLCGVFDDAVTIHMQQLHGNATDLNTVSLDSVIQDACGILLNFIKTNPRAWAPIISAWSLELLGRISSKYTHYQGVPLANSLNELLQQWMTCKPTKSLIEVSTECFAAMVGGAPDTCVDALLEATVKYSPYFDWVVAHIGSCFPTTIITRVLMCGLKDFCHHSNKSTDIEMMSEEKIPKLASVVGILGHLASKHSQDIRQALMKLFEESLQADGDVIKMTTVPFLTQLASMSNMLLQVLTTHLVKALTPTVLNKLSKQFDAWNTRNPNEFESFLGLVVLLVMRTEGMAYHVLLFLLDTAVPLDSGSSAEGVPSQEVKDTCAVVIKKLLCEIQGAVFFKQREIPDVPFLSALKAHTEELTQILLQSDGQRSEWLLKLLAYIAMYSGEDCSSYVLADVASNAENHVQFCKFIQLQNNIEVRLGDILPSTAQKIADLLGPDGVKNPERLMKNILSLIKWEKSSSISKKNRSSLTHCLQPHLNSLIPLICHEAPDISMLALKILNQVGVPITLTTDTVLHLCSSVVTFFFQLLDVTDSKMAFHMFKVCHECMKQICRQSFIQCILIRFIIEGIFIPEIGNLLGAKVDPSSCSTDKKPAVSLLEENKKHGLTLTLPRSHSSVFHAGVIGSGLKQRITISRLTKDQVTRNKLFVADLLKICSHQQIPDVAMETDTENHSQKKAHHLLLSDDLCRMVGSLVTELATPDVLYNNRFWPEEESIRMTVERDLQVWRCFDDNPVIWDIIELDLQVWRCFDDNPVIWDIIELYAGNSLAMCRCSPVLKSLTAALMNHFESSREGSARNSPKHMTAACRLVRCLGKSCLLPEPLKFVSELFPLVTSHEAFLLLLTVWRYMKENPPTEDPEETRKRVCESRHTEILRAILHSNIDKVGHLYPRFFSGLVT